MSATMARQGGRVQLEQSDLCLALDMAKIAKGGFSLAAIEETQHLINKPCFKVQEEMKWGVGFLGSKNTKAAIQRQLAMVQENQIDGCLPCHNGTAKNPHTRWRCNGTGAPPPELVPPPPGTPPGPPGDDDWALSSEIEVVPPNDVFTHTPLPMLKFFNLDAYAKDCKCSKDCIPDLLSDKRTSTG